MAAFDLPRTQKLLDEFHFGELFVEVLGWNRPTDRKESKHTVKELDYRRRMIAELSGVTVFEAWIDRGMADHKARDAIQRDVAKQHHENLVVVLDRPDKPTQSFWVWARREDGKRALREHSYFRGQPPDLFIGKIQALLVELSELDEHGRLPIIEVTQRLKQALDMEQTTKKFFREYEEQHGEFLELIEGIEDPRDRRWYASILLNRLMFIWFLQRKGFLDKQNFDYLAEKLKQSHARGPDLFFRRFLRRLFFEGFAKPPAERQDPEHWLGEIPYLNGGLFLPHRLEVDANGRLREDLRMPDRAFANLFALFGRYSWHLDDTPGGKADEINPDVLGYIFEKYINQKAFGAYYTRPEITGYLCERTLHALILDRVRQPAVPELKLPAVDYESVPELLSRMDGPLACKLVLEVLPNLKLLDPAVGSGAFLVAAMKALINVYAAVLGKADVLNNRTLTEWKKKLAGEHKNLGYGIKRQIITDNLYGVDIMQEACEIARLRLFLALVASARSVEELEPLPNIDFNILPGNSLIGLTQVDGKEFDDKHGRMGDLFKKSYSQLVEEKEHAVSDYRHYAANYRADLRSLREGIEVQMREAGAVLHDVLLGQMQRAGVKFEQATWDDKKNNEGKPEKRKLTPANVQALQPFHWGYQFHDILGKDGFDVILANPPWETIKPEAKEFFSEHSELVHKKKMSVKDFEKEQAKLLKDPDIREAWLNYLSRFPHQSAYFRSSAQYTHQAALVEGKRTGSDVNLYKLFVERCYSLLKPDGRCGIVVPSGFYTDLAATGLRRLLFDQAQVDAILSVSNERFLFEGVDHRFKYVFLTWKKGGPTESFRAAFRINPREAVGPREIGRFLNSDRHLSLSMEVVRHLSPETLSVMEFRGELDITIVKKMLRHPVLGAKLEGVWNFKLTNEIHISNDREHLKTSTSPSRLPLFTGKMFNQFTLSDEHSGYWLEEEAGRKLLLGKKADTGQPLDYQTYRWIHRRIARNTDSRTFITSIAPPNVFSEVNSTVIDVQASGINSSEQLFLCAATNSLALDWMLRQKVAATLNMFYIYQLPIPRLTAQDPRFQPIVSRAARLICTTPDFDELAKSVGLKSHHDGATDPAERAKLRAELDGLVAHLYELTEDEFVHILGTFPLVDEGQKQAALAAFRAFAPKTGDQEAAALIAGGESLRVEFKSTARWNIKEMRPDKVMEQIIVKTVAAFMNSEGGDLLIGVDDAGRALGLAEDYRIMGKKSDRDSYENWLTTLLLNAYGKDFAPCFKTSFPTVQDTEICRVRVQPSPKPCYADGKLYIRGGNTTRELTAQEAVAYARDRWP